MLTLQGNEIIINQFGQTNLKRWSDAHLFGVIFGNKFLFL